MAPYEPTFTITLESGLTRVLAGDSDSYVMTPFERLALAALDVRRDREHRRRVLDGDEKAARVAQAATGPAPAIGFGDPAGPRPRFSAA